MGVPGFMAESGFVDCVDRDRRVAYAMDLLKSDIFLRQFVDFQFI